LGDYSKKNHANTPRDSVEETHSKTKDKV